MLQLCIEKIFWDKIFGMLKTEKAREVRRRVDELKNEITKTRELIKWSYFLGAINYEEFKGLMEFSGARNKILHRRGEWWILEDNRKQYYEAKLKLAIQFLENNRF